MQPTSSVPVFVPIALPEDEALAAFNACRAVFQQLTALGKAASDGAELARAMYKMGEALDKARGVR